MMHFRFVAYLVLLLGSLSAFANDADAMKFISRCEHELNETKDYVEATKICKRVKLDVKVLVGLSPLYIRSIVNEADAKWAVGNYSEAFILYTEAAGIADKLGDANKVRELRIRQAESELYRGKSIEAEILLRDALERLRKTKPGRSAAAEEVNLLTRHATVLVSLNQTQAALAEYETALAKLEWLPRSARPVALKAWLGYAELFERRSRYTASLEAYKHLADLAKAKPVDEQYLALAYQRMAWIQETLRNPGEAISMYRRQLSVVENSPGRSNDIEEIRKKIQVLQNS